MTVPSMEKFGNFLTTSSNLGARALSHRGRPEKLLHDFVAGSEIIPWGARHWGGFSESCISVEGSPAADPNPACHNKSCDWRVWRRDGRCGRYELGDGTDMATGKSSAVGAGLTTDGGDLEGTDRR
ncbi:hypothetical protein E2562_039447 [Oryza meyeriana var. granulata]|uniref:Uncharacterized protein n=1 Tax=Oryza meyeriana var. granulata TaxID=110450 RepID=A0A6G1CKZ6_9ORYZ|nr:hypothetical protein E2562_039447 [Oryza meyeriana var. granulata]